MTSLRSLASARRCAAIALVALTATTLAACTVGSSATPPAPTAAADRLLAAKLNLTLADLSTGFAKVDESFNTKVQLATKATCLTPPASLLSATARHSREFSYHLDAAGREAGHVSSLVTVGASKDQNSKNFAVISSDAYEPCVTTSLTDFLTAATAQLVGTVTVARSTAYPGLSAPSVVYEAQVPFSYAGAQKIEYETDVHISSGRVTAHLIADRCCSDSADPTWTQLIQRLSTQLAKAVKQ